MNPIPKLLVHSRAARYIKRMNARMKAQLIVRLQELARNPGAMAGVKPMSGEWAGFYRLRHANLELSISTTGQRRNGNRPRRTARGCVQVDGSAGVADSIPRDEYEQTMNKAKAMLEAVEIAQGGFK